MRCCKNFPLSSRGFQRCGVAVISCRFRGLRHASGYTEIHYRAKRKVDAPGLCFEQRPPLSVGISMLLNVQGFQRDKTVQLDIAGLVDLTHAPSPKKGEDLIRADTDPCIKSHKR